MRSQDNSLGLGLNSALSYIHATKPTESAKLNEDWGHLGLLLELNVNGLGGWIGIGYGGDTSRRSKPDSKFELHYTIYKDPFISK